MADNDYQPTTLAGDRFAQLNIFGLDRPDHTATRTLPWSHRQTNSFAPKGRTTWLRIWL